MSVIWFVSLLQTVMRNVLFEYQLVFTDDLELTRFCDVHALMLLYLQAYCSFMSHK